MLVSAYTGNVATRQTWNTLDKADIFQRPRNSIPRGFPVGREPSSFRADSVPRVQEPTLKDAAAARRVGRMRSQSDYGLRHAAIHIWHFCDTA